MTKIPRIWDSSRMSILLDICDPHPKPCTTDFFCKYGMTRSELQGRALAEIISSTKEKDGLIKFLNYKIQDNFDEALVGLIFHIFQEHYLNDRHRDVFNYSINKDQKRIYERTIQTLKVMAELGVLPYQTK